MIRFYALIFAGFRPAVASAQDPRGLSIRIVEGEGQAYALGSHATRGITVEIADDLGRPVDSATVTFRLPEEGPSGTFASGSKTEIVTTRGDGRANAWGMQWNRTAGSFEVRITASKGNVRAGTVCALTLTKASDILPAEHRAAGGSHKWLWVVVAAGAAAGGGLAAAHGVLGGSSSAAPAAVSSTIIGTPTIAIGHP